MEHGIENELHTIGEELKHLNAQIAAIRETWHDERISARARRERSEADQWNQKHTMEKLNRLLNQALDDMDRTGII